MRLSLAAVAFLTVASSSSLASAFPSGGHSSVNQGGLRQRSTDATSNERNDDEEYWERALIDGANSLQETVPTAGPAPTDAPVATPVEPTPTPFPTGEVSGGFNPTMCPTFCPTPEATMFPTMMPSTSSPTQVPTPSPTVVCPEPAPVPVCECETMPPSTTPVPVMTSSPTTAASGGSPVITATPVTAPTFAPTTSLVPTTSFAPTSSPTNPVLTCRGIGWGDVHFVTFDGLAYDCHAPGELILVKSTESPFQIQVRSTDAGGPSVTTGVAIQEYTEAEGSFPLIQVSMNTLTESDSTSTISGCTLAAYVDGAIVSSFSQVSASTSGAVEASVSGSTISVTYPSTGLTVALDVNIYRGVCYFSGSYILRSETEWCREDSETLVGILGTPTGDTSDDWTSANGTVLSLPSGNFNTNPVSTQYCAEHWCLRESSDSLFSYEPGTDFSTFEDCDNDLTDLSDVLVAVENASTELQELCDGDVACLIDGVTLGVEAAETYLEYQEANPSVPRPSTSAPTFVCPEPVTCPEPTPAPTLVCPEPVTCPEVSPAPTASPIVGSTPAPVSEPTGDGIVRPSNDDCGTARTLVVNGSPVIGTTVNASATVRDMDVLYTFTGTGGLIRVSTCFNQTTTPHNFVLQTHGCILGGHEGIDFGETSGDNLGICGDITEDGASYEFASISGVPYYISVSPREDGNSGDFAIQLSSSANPINDNANGIALSVNNDFVLGSTVNATTQTWANDVWYNFYGNGRRLQVTTCSDDTTTPHNFGMEQYNSVDGRYRWRTLVATVATNGGYCDNHDAAAFEFDSVGGRQYRVYVGPRNAGQTGQFAIRVTDYVNPSNDYWGNQVALSVNDDFVLGSTINATAQTWANDVWYNFYGNGRRLQLTTCSDDTTTPHNFGVQQYSSYEGRWAWRDIASSVTTNGGYCDDPDAAAVEFDSGSGIQHRVYVAPRNPGQTGQFAIRVTDYVNPINDYWGSRITLSVNDDFVLGSTINATAQTWGNDVFYNFYGNGRRLQVTTCSDDTTTPHNFGIQQYSPYEGRWAWRSVVSAVTTNGGKCDDGGAAVFEFNSGNGIQHQLYVGPRNPGQTGQFAIRVLDAPTNAPTVAPTTTA